MAFRLSAFPQELLRSRRWAVELGEEAFRGLLLEQALLLAYLSMAPKGVAFELGPEEGLGRWCFFYLPTEKATSEALRLRGEVLPTTLSFRVLLPGGKPAWGNLFLAEVEPPSSPFVLKEGLLRFGDTVTRGSNPVIPRLGAAEISRLEEGLANL